ncbi:MAG: hypothetical protein WC729_05555 [Sphingomonas sp.]|jgi:hypothetical protein|uniref:hypothetical protein n=1 Tax=Sphingomonas sp. TaxID=28214 RepID=UPI00356856CF
MKVARLCLAMIFAALLCGAAEPDVRTIIVLAKPVKALKLLGTDEADGVFLVKMKTILVARGTFPKKTFNVQITAHMRQYIFDEKEYAVVFNRVDGKYESHGTAIVQRHVCFPTEFLKVTDIPPETLSRIVDPGNHYPDAKCYELP